MHSIKATETSPDQEESVGLLGFYSARNTNWFAELSTKFPLVTLFLAATNAITVAALLFLLLSPNRNFDSKDLTTVVYPEQPEWFPPQSTCFIHFIRATHLQGPKKYHQRIYNSGFNFANAVTLVPVTKILEADKLYGQAPNPESIAAWNSLLPSK
jgi:hypothetical protein